MTIQAYYANGDYAQHCLTSLSTVGVARYVIPFRNPIDAQGHPRASSLPRIVVTELAFAALAIASSVEMVVRAVLAALFAVMGLGLSCCSQDLSKWAFYIAAISLVGGYVCVQNALTCLAALFVNVYKCSGTLLYAEILPCFEDLNQTLFMRFMTYPSIGLAGGRHNRHHVAFVNTVVEKIREIPAELLRQTLIRDFPEQGNSLQLRVIINDGNWARWPLTGSRCSYLGGIAGVVPERLERKLQEMKQLFEGSSRTLLSSVDFIPKEIKIRCRLMSSSDSLTAIWTTTVRRSGDHTTSFEMTHRPLEDFQD